MALGPSVDLTIDPIQGTNFRQTVDGDVQNTNLSDDVVITDGSLSVGRSGNSTGGDYRAFMKFDLAAIPAESTIAGATLRVNLVSTEPYGSANLRRVTARDWTPSDVVYSLGGTNGSTFISNFAANQGGSTPPALGWYDLNVLSVVGGWFAGSNANYGFALRSGAEGWGGTRRNFASSSDPLGRGPELVIGYDAPPNLDSDGDSLADEWEIAHWGDLDAVGAGDDDGDGRDNATEYGLGSDPQLFDFRPVLGVERSGGGVTLHFMAARATGSGYYGVGRFHTLESSENLMPGSWAGVPGYIDLEGADQMVVCVIPADDPRRFFRLRVRLQRN